MSIGRYTICPRVRSELADEKPMECHDHGNGAHSLQSIPDVILAPSVQRITPKHLENELGERNRKPQTPEDVKHRSLEYTEILQIEQVGLSRIQVNDADPTVVLPVDLAPWQVGNQANQARDVSDDGIDALAAEERPVATLVHNDKPMKHERSCNQFEYPKASVRRAQCKQQTQNSTGYHQFENLPSQSPWCC